MDISISINHPFVSATLKITGSKSETNRLLLLQALYPEIEIKNLSESDDSHAMQKALADTGEVVDIHHAGTAMRFLTAYFAQKAGSNILLTGSRRMQERPIGVLVDALRNLGADIKYQVNEGYPPLKIKGTPLVGGKATINAGVSSQYITALLLIAPKLKQGLELELEGELTSIPYIKMTLGLLEEVGIKTTFKGNSIKIAPVTNTIKPATVTVESDWSSASYFYSIVALSPVGTSVTLSAYKKHSLQGDSALAEIYKDFGVRTAYAQNSIIITKQEEHTLAINLDLNHTPDIAQTIAVTCFGLGMGCQLTGLHTLKIKETDRLEALKTELGKFNADISVTNDSLTLQAHSLFKAGSLNSDIEVATYNDHRMAMAFAPLAIKTAFKVKDADVVSKSYPDFWQDMQRLGFNIREL